MAFSAAQPRASDDEGTSPSLLIVGASARAAAHSALRAGMTPVAVDLFADRDLLRAARVLPVGRWPADVPAAAREAPPGPWMYTGALENHPRVVAALAAERPLWGNAADVLRRVRDPRRVCAALSEAGLPALEVRTRDRPPPADGSWLLKPRRGAGGRGIRRWTASAAASGTPREPYYFQRLAPGVPVSAVYVGGVRQSAADGAASPDRPAGRVDHVGATQQLIGLESLGAAPFAWCGSIGPLTLPGHVTRQIAQTGYEIGQRFGLVGLFGIDFVLSGDGIAWPTEVNPRYTASVEVLEHAFGHPLLDLHRRACTGDPGRDLAEAVRKGGLAPGCCGLTCDWPQDGGCLSPFSDSLADGPLQPASAAHPVVAKAVLYAPRDLRMPPLNALEPPDPIGLLSAYADLPHDGARIPRGRPVCTVLAAGTTRADCLDLLEERLARLRSILGLPDAGQVGRELDVGQRV